MSTRTILVARRNKAARIIREEERRAGRRFSEEERLSIAKKQGVTTKRQLQLGLISTSQATRTTGGATSGGRPVGVQRKESLSAFSRPKVVRETKTVRASRTQPREKLQATKVRQISSLPPTIQERLGVQEQKSPVFKQEETPQRILELEASRRLVKGSPAFQKRITELQNIERQKLEGTVTGGGVVELGGKQFAFTNVVIPKRTLAERESELRAKEQVVEQRRAALDIKRQTEFESKLAKVPGISGSVARAKQFLVTTPGLSQKILESTDKSIAQQEQLANIYKGVFPGQAKTIGKVSTVTRRLTDVGGSAIAGAVEGVRTEPLKTAGFALIGATVGGFGATALGAKALGSLAGRVGSAALAGVFVGGKTIELAGAQSEREFGAILGRTVSTEIIPLVAGAGAGSRLVHGARIASLRRTTQIRAGTKVETGTVILGKEARTAITGQLQFKTGKQLVSAKAIGKTESIRVTDKLSQSEGEFRFLIKQGAKKIEVKALTKGAVVSGKDTSKGVFAARIIKGGEEQRHLILLRGKRIATVDGFGRDVFGRDVFGKLSRKGFGSGVLRETLKTEVGEKQLIKAEFLGKTVETPKSPQKLRPFSGKKGQLIVRRPITPKKPVGELGQPKDFTAALSQELAFRATLPTRVTRRIIIQGGRRGTAVVPSTAQTPSEIAAQISLVGPKQEDKISTKPRQQQAQQTRQSLRRLLVTRQQTTQQQTTRPRTPFPIIATPIPPPVPFGGLPKIPIDLIFKEEKKPRKKKIKGPRSRFAPSLVAVDVGITGKVPKLLTGIEVRPLPIGRLR